MTAAHAIPGCHPKLCATHVRERLDALAAATDTVALHVACGALRYATPAERAAVRDSMAQLADALLGLAQHVDRWEHAA
jgi:hypothetical protein